MNLFDAVVFVLAGFGVVMVALAVLWWISALISVVIVRAGRGRALPTAASGVPAAAQPPALANAGAGVPIAHRIAIAAAVALATGGRGRVLAVHAPAHREPAWAGALRGAPAPAQPRGWGSRGSETNRDKP